MPIFDLFKILDNNYYDTLKDWRNHILFSKKKEKCNTKTIFPISGETIKAHRTPPPEGRARSNDRAQATKDEPRKMFREMKIRPQHRGRARPRQSD
ncbi:hypothetical protein EVAR_9125_1 [Eumeta japonica]|uniref:Uncharacterized protein n=1 Tax=Eumeta variegata TaxID=151549 RepID=A0A4C1TW67_EUMVA|nr:hypothetical protein EVAR_9125_1 [Eumeta japonica]